MALESGPEQQSKLSPELNDMTRAVASLMEELQATNWYAQRIEQCTDQELKEILQHNEAEEKEHSTMLLEWIRRNDPTVAKNFVKYLSTDDSVTKIEKS